MPPGGVGRAGHEPLPRGLRGLPRAAAVLHNCKCRVWKEKDWLRWPGESLVNGQQQRCCLPASFRSRAEIYIAFCLHAMFMQVTRECTHSSPGTRRDLAMDDARDDQIRATSPVFATELLTRNLGIPLDILEPVSAVSRDSRPGPIPEAVAVKLPDPDAKGYPLFVPRAFELEDSCSRRGSVPVIHFLQSPPHGMQLHTEALQRACQSSLTCTSLQPSDVARGSLLSLHPRILPLFRKPSRSSTLWRVETLSWLSSKLPAQLSEIARSSHLRACQSSLTTCTSLRPDVARGSLLSHPPAHGMLLHTEALQRSCLDLVSLDPRILPLFRKPSRSSTLWPVQTLSWLSSKRNMALQLPAQLSEIARSSHLRACQSSLTTCTSLRPDVARGSLLFHPPAHGMLLHTEALQRSCLDLVSLDPRILPLFRKPSRSSTLWPVQTSPWLSSKRNMALQLPARLSEIARSSQQRACQSSLTYTEVARGSLLSHPPPPVMLLLTGSLQLQRVCVDSVRFDLDILPKFRKLSRSSTLWPVQTSPWLSSKRNMALQLPARLSEIARSSQQRACQSSLTYTEVARGSLRSQLLPQVMLLLTDALQLQRVCVDYSILGEV